MRIRDYLIIGLVLLWLAAVLVLFFKKKRSGRCIGCCGDNCDLCNKKEHK